MAERYEYTRSRLLEAELADTPVDQLAQWLAVAKQEGVVEPSAMCLSTVSPEGKPSSRMVLLRGLDDRGLTFFTNYESRKGNELGENEHACLNFWWGPLERQVRIEGRVERVSAEESDAYWFERPLESQLASAASPQSQEVPDRAALGELVAKLGASGEPIRRPEHWGGYRLVPDRFEFWQGGPARLHDRLVYEKEGKNWQVVRLAP